MAPPSALSLLLALALAALALLAPAAEAARASHGHGRKLRTFGLLDSLVSGTSYGGGRYYNNDDDSYYYTPRSNYGYGYGNNYYVTRPSFSPSYYGRPYTSGWSNYGGGGWGRGYGGWGYGRK